MGCSHIRCRVTLIVFALKKLEFLLIMDVEVDGWGFGVVRDKEFAMVDFNRISSLRKAFGIPCCSRRISRYGSVRESYRLGKEGALYGTY